MVKKWGIVSSILFFWTGLWLSVLGALLKTPEVLLPFLGETEVVFEFHRNTTKLPHENDIVESDYTRKTVTFPSQGATIEAWHYMPSPQTAPAPLVIMGHGLGSQKDMGLHPYAEQFAQAGLAVLVIDYRGFGGSDGLPRHQISWVKQTQDYQAALDWACAGHLENVDASHIALWGVSYSGAHALMTAAKEENSDKVSAVVANEPFLTGDGNIQKALKERGILKVLRLAAAAVLDKLRELLGLGPMYVKLIGTFDELAILNMDTKELQLARGGVNPHTPPARAGGWKSLATPRFILDNMQYKPMEHVHKIKCPTLLVGGTKDVITPLHHLQKAQSLIGDKAQLLVKPWNHIELHKNGMQPQEVAPVIEFLRTHLGLKPSHVDTQPHEAHPEEMSSEVV